MASSLATTSSDSRLAQDFARLRAEGRAALIPYLTAGFPDRAASLALLRALDGTADVIEVGVPFSDPVADGPVIQRASFRALERGMSLAGTLDLIREAEYDYLGEPVKSVEHFFHHRAAHARIDTSGHTALEREVMQEHRWFTLDELRHA